MLKNTLAVYILLTALLIAAGCQNTSQKDQGAALAERHCQGCHLLPDPALADRSHWTEKILPQMGPRLGIFTFNGVRYPSSKGDFYLDEKIYPDKPQLEPEEWQQIINYYASHSADSLAPQIRTQPIKLGLSQFSVRTPSSSFSPVVSFIHIDSVVGEIYTADVFSRFLFRYNSSLSVIDSIRLSSPATSIDFTDPLKMMVCQVGIISPNNSKSGSGVFVMKENGSMKADTGVAFKGLMRPVQVTSVDYNSDGIMDYLVCEFGHLSGALSIMKGLGNGRFERIVIKNIPGAIRAYVDDINHDGLPDIWAMFTQGDESIDLFINKGNDQFEDKQVLRFPPSYGSSYFEFADMNHDQLPDIIYTCGDNSDFSPILKPYHGVYIYINKGNHAFEKQYFFPINGCYKAVARDFDGDGDNDLATISYFADYQHQPEEGFVYLQNDGHLNFQPYSMEETFKGRWLTMDVSDFDRDGFPDIVLANMSVGPSVVVPKFDFKNGPSFLLLKNSGGKK